MTSLNQVKGALSGYKTYIIAAVAFVNAALPVLFDWADGIVLPLEVLPLLWEAAVLPLLAATLRAGIAKSA